MRRFRNSNMLCKHMLHSFCQLLHEETVGSSAVKCYECELGISALFLSTLVALSKPFELHGA